jgi:hypothetical protein
MGKEYYRKNKDNAEFKEKRRVYMIKYRKEHKEKIKEISNKSRLKFRVENPQKVKDGAKKYRDAHKDQIRAYSATYRKNKTEVIKSKHEIWYTLNKQQENAKAKIRRFTKKYKISIEKYNELLENQNGVCAICGEKDSRGTALAVDHDHETQECRGLLCRHCNLGIGNFKNNPSNLDKASKYLQKNKL